MLSKYLLSGKNIKEMTSACTCTPMWRLDHPPETQIHYAIREWESWWKLSLISSHSSFKFWESLEKGSLLTQNNKILRKNLCASEPCDAKWHRSPDYLSPLKGWQPWNKKRFDKQVVCPLISFPKVLCWVWHEANKGAAIWTSCSVVLKQHVFLCTCQSYLEWL